MEAEAVEFSRFRFHIPGCSRSLQLSTSISLWLPIRPFHNLSSFPTHAWMSPKWIVDLLVLTVCMALLVSSRNSGYYPFQIGTYTCIKHKEMFDNFNMHRILCGLNFLSAPANFKPAPHTQKFEKSCLLPTCRLLTHNRPAGFPNLDCFRPKSAPVTEKNTKNSCHV